MFQAIAIRTRLACSGQTETPMVWLNECIDVLAKRKTRNDSSINEIGAITFDNLLRYQILMKICNIDIFLMITNMSVSSIFFKKNVRLNLQSFFK